MDDKRIEIEVEFTQKLTVLPPDSINSKVEADCWFQNDPETILRDGMDLSRGNIEVLSINEC
jgi:hypothetical protein